MCAKKKKSCQIHWLSDLSRAFPVKGATQWPSVFFPLTRLLCSLTPVAAHVHCTRLSRAPPLPTSRLLSLSCLPPSSSVAFQWRETPGVEGSALPAATSTPHGFRNIRWPSSLTHQRTTPERFWAKREGTLKSLLKKIAGGKIARHKAVMGSRWLVIEGNRLERCIRYIGTFLHQCNGYILTFSGQYVVTFSRRQVSRS